MTPIHCAVCGKTFLVCPGDVARRKTCSHACANVIRRGYTDLVEAFWARVKERDGCLEWQGERDRKGYGRYRRKRAHRWAWELTFGPIPDGLFVCHHCDNPPCVNPAHLFLGTAKDNAQDMSRKGRSARNKPSMNQGEAHGQAKLTESQVIEIRAVFKRYHPQFGATALARKYGVSRQTIGKAATGKKWKSVQ